MSRNPRPWQLRLLAILSLPAVLAACDAGGSVRPLASSTDAAALAQIEPLRRVDLGSCTNLAVGEPHRVSARMYATGTQNYSWDGSAWLFTGPEAELYANANGRGPVGRHFAGPTWVSKSGSGVVAAVVGRCTPDAGAIPWLLLAATSSHGPGIFDGTTYIQRLGTTGGLMPATPGTFVGEQARVPYTAEYVFYR